MLSRGREWLLSRAPQVAQLTSSELERKARVNSRINRGNDWQCSPEYFRASRP